MIIPLIGAFIFTIAFEYICSHLKNDGDTGDLSTPSLFLYGIIYGFGAIMPGMTTIHILIYMGVVAQIMGGIFAINLSTIIPFGLGYLAIVLLIANLITYLFKKFYGATYYAIIGFAIVSLTMLIPDLTSPIEYILGITYAFIAFVITYFSTTLGEKYLKN